MKILLVIPLLFLFSLINAQETSKLMCLVGGCEEPIDTSSLEKVHRYKGNLDYLSIGNVGLTGYNLLFNIDHHSKFRWSRFIGNKSYLPKEYDVKRPYTMVNFVFGSKQEQVLHILHTQNISKQANFSFGYDKIKSIGLYVNQASNNDHFYANTWFKTKNENYKVSLNFDHERIFNEHNGGIVYDSLFEQDLLLNRNRELMEVNLSEASSTVKRTQLNLNQSFNFIQSIDTLGKGTTHGLVLNFKASKNYRVFKDTLLNFNYFSQTLLDSTATHDEVLFNTIDGTVGYRFVHVKKSKIIFQPYFKMEWTKYQQSIIDTLYATSNVGLDILFEKDKFNFSTKGEYYLNGYRENNVELNVNALYKFSSNWSFGTSIFYNSNSPSLDLLSYSGNNVNWSNAFTTSEHLNFSGSLNSDKYKTQLKVSYNDIFNPVYFDVEANPQQIEGVSQVIQVSAFKEFHIGNWIARPKVAYQYQGGYDIYRLPEYYTDLTLGYNANIFKNNLHLFLGVDVVYYAPIPTMGYNPMINQYYINDTKTIGNYPFIDFFFNARIKSVRFFIKVSHINASLLDFSYYGAKGYPLKDRTMQFGLNWNFLN